MSGAASDLDQIRESLYGLSLAEVKAKWDRVPRDIVVLVEPVLEQAPCGVGSTRVVLVAPDRLVAAPCIDSCAQLLDERIPRARPPAAWVHLPDIELAGRFLEKGRWSKPRAPVRYLGQLLVVGDDAPGHRYLTSTSTACDVSLPKTSTTFTSTLYLPGLSYV